MRKSRKERGNEGDGDGDWGWGWGTGTGISVNHFLYSYPRGYVLNPIYSL
jgi:hypothetical protein